MNKRIYLIIIWTITFGVAAFTCYKSINGGLKFVKFDNGITIGNEDESKHITGHEGALSLEVEPFTKLEVDAGVMGVSVKKGTSYSVYCSYSSQKLEPVIENKGDTLVITQHSQNFNGDSSKCEMTITVPKNITLDDIYADIKVGAFEIDGISLDKGKINTDVGAIEIRDCEFNKLNMNSNVGAIQINLTGKTQDYDWDLTTSLGAIEVRHRNYHRSYFQNNNSGKKITAKSNIGAIEVK